MAGFDQRPSDGTLVGAYGRDVVDLDGLPVLHHPSRHPLALWNRRHATGRLEHGGVVLVGIVARAEAKLLARSIVFPDGAACRPPGFLRPEDDGLEHRLHGVPWDEGGPDHAQCRPRT